MNINIKHKEKNQSRYGKLHCYGRRIKLPKKLLITAYSFLAVLIPVIIPIWLAPFVGRFIPDFVRVE